MCLRYLRIFILCLLTLFVPRFAAAQSTTGSIYGAVTDPSGAVIPTASVQIKNIHTNVTEAVVTNGKGEFLFTIVNPGEYVLTVAAPGCKAKRKPG